MAIGISGVLNSLQTEYVRDYQKSMFTSIAATLFSASRRRLIQNRSSKKKHTRYSPTSPVVLLKPSDQTVVVDGNLKMDANRKVDGN